MKYGKSAGLLIAVLCCHGAYAGPAEDDCKAPLIRTDQPWQIEYDFGGGIMPGAGELKLVLDNNGQATLRTTRPNKKPTVRQYRVPAPALASLVRVLNANPLQCLNTVRRQGVVDFDVGHALVRFAGQTTAEASYDACHYIDDPASFGKILAAIRNLEPYLGKEIRWASVASVGVESDACSAYP